MDIEPFVLHYSAKNTAKMPKTYLNALTRLPGWNDSDCLGENIHEAVRSLPRGKKQALIFYKTFVRKLQGELGITVSVPWPPIDDIDSALERQLFLLEYIQNPAHKTTDEDLADLLWVSPRTISDDWKGLMGSEITKDLCGHPLYIDSLSRSGGQVHQETTAHPIRLVFNLSQLLATMLGLMKMSKEPLFRAAATDAASVIWNQLTEYAKGRICTLLEDFFDTDTDWLRQLPPLDPHARAHHSDRDTANMVHEEPLLYWVKSGAPATLTLKNQPVPLENCIAVPSASHDCYTFSCKGKTMTVASADIVKVVIQSE